MGNGGSFHAETCSSLQSTIAVDASLAGKNISDLDPENALLALQIRDQAATYKDVLPKMNYSYACTEKIYQQQDDNAGDLVQAFQPSHVGCSVGDDYIEINRTYFIQSAQNLFLALLNHESMGAQLSTYSGIAALDYMCGHPLTDKDQLLARHTTLQGLAGLGQYDFCYLHELVKNIGKFEESLIDMDFTMQEQLGWKRILAATVGASVLPALGGAIALASGGFAALPAIAYTGMKYIAAEALWDTGSWVMSKAVTRRALWQNNITPVLNAFEPNTSIIKSYGGLFAKQALCSHFNPTGNPLAQPIVYMPVNTLKQGLMEKVKEWRKRSNLGTIYGMLCSYFSLVQHKLYELCSDSRLVWLNNEWVEATLTGDPIEDTSMILALFGKLDVYLQLVSYVQATQRNDVAGSQEYFIEGLTFEPSAPLLYSKDFTYVVRNSDVSNKSLQSGGNAAIESVMDVLLKAQTLCITNRPGVLIHPIKLQDSYLLHKAREIQFDLHMEPIA